MCLYSIQRLDSRTMFLNVFLVFLQNCLTDTRGILGYNRKAPRVEEKKKTLFLLKHTNTCLSLQVHLNKLECRGKVHLFQ